jgi:hypothetical protein
MIVIVVIKFRDSHGGDSFSADSGLKDLCGGGPLNKCLGSEAYLVYLKDT